MDLFSESGYRTSALTVSQQTYYLMMCLVWVRLLKRVCLVVSHLCHFYCFTHLPSKWSHSDDSISFFVTAAHIYFRHSSHFSVFHI